ncbi:Asparaginase/glutaminase [Ilyonectria sp. MPI-CAGE-AT-0026]|nr:Asparaginase/glutaminase [Ilyonectria sp. MPI-CAGE-AT-0026]
MAPVQYQVIEDLSSLITSSIAAWTSCLWRFIVFYTWTTSVWVSQFPGLCLRPHLPNIAIYATGGTTGGSASSADQIMGYQAGALGVQALIDAVPQMCNVSNMIQMIQDILNSPYTQGAVVTHGSDTLEESAFFLDLTIQSDKGVVVTGSMRPATAVSADGPMNLLSSVAVAGSDNARHRGVMIVLSGRIGSARFMSKSNANQLDAFQSADGGFQGGFHNIQSIIFYPPSRPLGRHHFDPPQVDVLYAHQELNVDLFQAAIDLRAKGLIRHALQDTDIPVIVSRRPGWGFASSNGLEGGIGADFLNPQKARIQLQLTLETGLEIEVILLIFEHHRVH